MKKIIVVIILIIIVSLLNYIDKNVVNDRSYELPVEITAQEGTYTGKGEGFVSEIIVEVTFKKIDGKVVMTDIKVMKSDEIKKYWVLAKENIISEVLKKQDVDIDAVSGATQSSIGLLEAIKDARKKSIIRY